MRKQALILLVPLALGAQQFEVASVKPAAPDAPGSTFNFTQGGGLSIRNGDMRGILEAAFDVREFQIEGGPAWMNTVRYDIYAKSEFGEDPAGRPTPETVRQTRLKLQALLAERFQLKVHRESRELPVYALAVGKNGPKLTAGTETPNAGINSGCGRFTGTYTGMDNFALSLSRRLGRPVQDRTGLSGKFNFQVLYTPDNGPCEGASADLPSIFGALQEQLGLKLESSRGPVEVVIIEHMEKPAEN